MRFRDPIEWERTLPIRPSSLAWRATIKSVYGSPLDDEELAMFRELTSLDAPPVGGSDEALDVAGRRGGKTETIARVATFEACEGGHAVALAPGQVGVFAVVCPLREQATELIRYVKGLAALPAIRKRVTAETSDGVVFGQCAIRVMTADAVALSGITAIGGVFDEAAKLPGDDAAVPDRELRASFRPALAPVRGAPRRRFWMITSAWIDEGLAFETERDNFAKTDAPVLCFRGPTTLYNPAIDREWLAREQKRDPRSFAREFECVWTSGISDGFFPAEAIDRCIDKGRESGTKRDGVRYALAIDPAWSGDQFAMAVAHREKRDEGPPVTVVDYVGARKAPKGQILSVDRTMAWVASIAHAFGVRAIFSDQKDIVTLQQIAARHGLHVIERAWNASNKSPIYRRIRDAMVDGLVRLPDDPDTIREMRGMRSRLLRSGVEQIDGRGADDRVSALVMAANEAIDRLPEYVGTTQTAVEIADAIKAQLEAMYPRAAPNFFGPKPESEFAQRHRAAEWAALKKGRKS